METNGTRIYRELVKYKGVPPIIGGISVQGLIGSGGMGAVFRGTHLGLKIPVAIKFCYNLPDGSDAKFFDEAMLAAKINHPNVVRVYDVKIDGDFRYIVQEFVEGQSAEERMGEAAQTQKPLTEEFVLSLAADVARGLAALHAENLLHLDIKPTNIMISQRNGACKILDLGLAKRFSPTLFALNNSAKGQSADGGTPGYSSPEQLRAEPVGPPSDIYSLGVTLFELLSSQRAFAATSWNDALETQQISELPDIRTLRPDITENTARLIERCVKIDPAERFQSAMELLSAIENAFLSQISRSINLSDTQLNMRAVHLAEPAEPLVYCVDDDPMLCEFMGDLLREAGFRVETFMDGRKALMKMLSERPNVVFLDSSIPGMSGMDVCKAMRAHILLKKIPIIFFTGNTHPDAMKLAVIEGATDYLFKPVQAEELIDRARCFARINQAQREMEQMERQHRKYRKRLTTLLVGTELK